MHVRDWSYQILAEHPFLIAYLLISDRRRNTVITLHKPLETEERSSFQISPKPQIEVNKN